MDGFCIEPDVEFGTCQSHERPAVAVADGKLRESSPKPNTLDISQRRRSKRIPDHFNNREVRNPPCSQRLTQQPSPCQMLLPSFLGGKAGHL